MLKTNLILPYFLFGALLILSACKSSDDSIDPLPAVRTFADVEADFQALDISAGIHDVSLEIADGVFYDFRIIAPERTAEEKDR